MNKIVAEKYSLPLVPWSCRHSSSPKQLFLNRTKAGWSNRRLLALLEDLDVPIENAREPQKAKVVDSENLLRGLPRKLPLSPLMDPNFTAARQRHREPKPKLQGLSPMERKLRENPYAKVLACPIRHCGFTGVRLPRNLLLTFGIANHPETGKPWHLPRISSESFKTTKEARLSNAPAGTSNFAGTVPEPPPTKGSAFFSKSGSYFLSSRSVLQIISAKERTPKHTNPYHFRSLPARWKADPLLKPGTLVWRTDMDDFVLEQLRKHTVKVLEYAATSFESHLHSKNHGNKPRLQRSNLAAVLWLGKPAKSDTASSIPAKHPAYMETVAPQSDSIISPVQQHQEHEEEPGRSASPDALHLTPEEGPDRTTNPPPFYAMVSYRSKYVPIYNLPILLGSKHLETLRKLGSSLVEEESLFVRQRQKTIELQMALWRLMGYMAPLEDQGLDHV